MTPPFKTAWITGATSGLGRTLALALAHRRTVIAASARSRERLENLVAGGSIGAGRILPTPLDVTDRSAVLAATPAVVRVFGGPPELVILAAGVSRPVVAAGFDAAHIREQVEVNLMGAVHMLEALLPPMLAAGRGHIVAVDRGAGGAALTALCKTLNPELDRSGITLQVLRNSGAGEFGEPWVTPPAAEDGAVDRMIGAFGSGQFEIALARRASWWRRLTRGRA